MKVAIKTLSKKQHIIDIGGEATILELKLKLKELENLDESLIKLIYQGQILQDNATIDSYKIKESDFVVLFVNKAKPTTPLVAAQKTPEPSTETKKPEPAEPKAPELKTAVVSAPATDSLVTGESLELAITSLMEMGFERSLVESALHASFNNPDRAAEYLFSGHIPNIEPRSASRAGSSHVHTGKLDFLRQDPQFLQLRTVVQQNPNLIQPLLQQIGTANPRLLQLINENQEEFLSLLNEDVEGHAADDDEDHPQLDEMEEETEYHLDPEKEAHLRALLGDNLEDIDPSQLEALIAAAKPAEASTHVAPAEADDPANQGATASGAPMTQYIQVTPLEKEAIDRLVALGFERARVIEAFFACDKDETLAANFLFDNIQDD